MIYFTSDTHFSHANIMRYCDRPFTSVEEMDETIIQRWNSVVKPGDTVYHLGDFGFTSEEKLSEIIGRLSGQKFLIFGNHDKTIRRSQDLKKKFIKCSELLDIRVGEQAIVLCHYAMLVWNKRHHGAWMLHGHSHGTLSYPFEGRIMDVGVDANNFYPISFDEVKQKLEKIVTGSLDHHR